MCVVVCLIRTKQISARMVRMPRSRRIITRFQLSDRLFALPTHPRYHSLPAKRVQGTLTLWEDMGQKYNDDYIRKKEREEKKLHNKKREKPSCVQTSLMKTTRNPPSSSLQNSEAELAFCGDIILTPRFFVLLFFPLFRSFLSKDTVLFYLEQFLETHKTKTNIATTISRCVVVY